MNTITNFKQFLYHNLHLKWFIFQYVNKKFNLNVDYSINKNGVPILQEVFIKDVYRLPIFEIPNPLIVDIGAHYGYFSLFANRNYGESARIIAIEPSSGNINILRKNISAGGAKNIEILPFAIAKDNGERVLFLSKDQNHSIYQNYVEDHRGKEEVKSISLSTFLHNNCASGVSLLKMDCEGSEHEILMSSTSSDLSKIHYLFIEMHHIDHPDYSIEKTLDHLKSNGFDIYSSNSLRLVNYCNFMNFVVLLKNSIYDNNTNKC